MRVFGFLRFQGCVFLPKNSKLPKISQNLPKTHKNMQKTLKNAKKYVRTQNIEQKNLKFSCAAALIGLHQFFVASRGMRRKIDTAIIFENTISTGRGVQYPFEVTWNIISVLVAVYKLTFLFSFFGQK